MLTSLRRWVRRHFGFSRAETNGFALLLLLLLALLAAPTLLRPSLPHYDATADRKQLDQIAAELAAQRPANSGTGGSRYPRRAYTRTPDVPQIALAPFDPNTVDETGWQARGLPRYLAQRLVRYRDAIGGFKAKEQIRKAYGLTEEQYTRLSPYLQLPEQMPPHAGKQPHDFANRYPNRWTSTNASNVTATAFPRKPKHLVAFDLNTADTTQLMQIRGIGRKLSARVVEYRELLGGFVRPDQLSEIYSLRDAPDLVDSLRKYTFVGPSYTPMPLNVNSSNFDELWQHPYVGKRLARLIVAYRQQHGAYKKPDDLRQIKVLDEPTYQKLLPYLRF